MQCLIGYPRNLPLQCSAGRPNYSLYLVSNKNVQLRDCKRRRAVSTRISHQASRSLTHTNNSAIVNAAQPRREKSPDTLCQEDSKLIDQCPPASEQTNGIQHLAFSGPPAVHSPGTFRNWPLSGRVPPGATKLSGTASGPYAAAVLVSGPAPFDFDLNGFRRRAHSSLNILRSS